jgi:monothiol glutaredoxin
VFCYDKINWNFLLEKGGNMNVNERIKEQLDSNPVILYMKGTPDFPQCGFSGQTVQVLNACDAKYTTVNIFEDPELREALKIYSNWPTYPQLYIGGELVGGCDIVTDLYQKGELKGMLSAVGGVEA